MSITKTRLDLLLEETGLFASRQTARTAIMDGSVLVDGVKITKPGMLVKADARIELAGNRLSKKYVSRGGFKLEKALGEFNLSVAGRVCLDVGASTGGFTDCLLQAGAKKVFAVDVGYGQIAWSLRTDERVKVIERTNARFLNSLILKDIAGCDFYEAPELAVVDVSFISLIKVLPAVALCLAGKEAQIIALVKPQFEAGPQSVGKKGVVRSASIHQEVLVQLARQASGENLFARKLTFSPLKGPQGNIEFLMLFALSEPAQIDEGTIASVVAEAALALN